MASITLVSDLTLETATDASISNPSGGTDIVSITWDSGVEISSYSEYILHMFLQHELRFLH